MRRCKRLSLLITRNCKHCDSLSPHCRGLLRSSWFRPPMPSLSNFLLARLVKKHKLPVSRGCSSQPQDSLPTCLALLRSPMFNTKRNLIIREKKKNYCCRWRAKKPWGDYIDSYSRKTGWTVEILRPRGRLSCLTTRASWQLSWGPLGLA